MKRIVLLVIAVAAATTAYAQSDAQTIEKALMAAPARAREGAGVVQFDRMGNRTVLKESTNGLVCYDRSGSPGTPAFAVQCTDEGSLDRVGQTLKAYADGGDRQSGEKLLDAMEANGTRIPPAYGGMWYTMNGESAETARVHVTIAVPGATAESLGIPPGNSSSRMWIMDAGTSTAHLMIPGH